MKGPACYKHVLSDIFFYQPDTEITTEFPIYFQQRNFINHNKPSKNIQYNIFQSAYYMPNLSYFLSLQTNKEIKHENGDNKQAKNLMVVLILTNL